MNARSLFLSAVLTVAAAARAGAAAPPPSGPLSDAEILAVVDAANQGEIDAARVAKSKGRAEDVKRFARHMDEEHGAAKQKLQGLASKLELQPAQTEFSATLKRHSLETVEKLESEGGGGFDRAYVDSQVADHASLLSALDTSLIPSAKSPEVQRFLKELRPVVAKHLEKARKLQSAIAK